MADPFQIQYRQEFIASFEQRQSLLRDTVTTEIELKGNRAVFLVAGSGSDEAVTRGANGMIPAKTDTETQYTATLQEWHDLRRKTGFNIFASQGNQRDIMQQNSMAVINRKIDSDIIGALSASTTTAGSATTIPSVNLFMNCQVKLSNAGVPWDSNITLLCTPAFLAYLEAAPEFSSADYVDTKPNQNADGEWRDKAMAYRWRNSLIISHPNLSGIGTSSEISYMYHKSAIGHAVDTAGLKSLVGVDEEQDYSWARTSIFMGSKLLQTSGVVKITADGSALA